MRTLKNTEADKGSAAAGPAIDVDALLLPDDGEKYVSLAVATPPNADPPKTDPPKTVEPPKTDPPPATAWEGLQADKMYAFAKEKYKEFLPQDWKDPENITMDNIHEVIAEMAYNTANWDDVFNPEVLQFQEAITAFNGDVDKAFEEYTKHRSWKTMPDENLLKWHYKENLKIPDDKLESAMKGVNQVVEAAKVRQELEVTQNNWLQQQQQENTKAVQKARDESNTAREQEIVSALDAFEKKSDIWGIPLDAKLKEEFKSTIFRKWVTPGQDGVAPIAKLLGNSDFLTGIVLFAEKNDFPIKELIFNIKQGVKDDIKSRLDPEPKFNTSASRIDPAKIDVDRLTEPDDGRP